MVHCRLAAVLLAVAGLATSLAAQPQPNPSPTPSSRSLPALPTDLPEWLTSRRADHRPYRRGSYNFAVYNVQDLARDLNAVDVGLTIATTMQRLYGTNFAADKMQVLLREPTVLAGIKAGKSPAELKAGWAADLEAFRKRREPFLLYR